MNNTIDIGNNKSIFVALTYICTAHCKKCITRYHRFLNKTMDIDTLEATIYFLKEINFRGNIVLGSAEPLGYPNIELFLTNLLNINDNIKVQLLTNGKLLKKGIPNIIFSDRITIGITLDGMKADELEGLQEGIDIEKIKKQIEEVVKEYGPEHFYLNYTLNKKSMASFYEYVDFARALGIKEYYVTGLKYINGVDISLSDYIINDGDLKAFFAEAKEHLFDKGLKKEELPLGMEESKTAKVFCWNQNKANPIIDIDGSITFCAGREDGIIGNVAENNIQKKWKEKYLFFENNKLEAGSWCQKCCYRCHNGVYFSPREIYTGIK